MKKITPFLWFETQAEEAANFYVSIFDNSRIVKVTRFGEAGPGPKGSVMTVNFVLDGQEFTALNGGPQFKFTEAISFMVDCQTQEEVDRFWGRLTEGGQEGPLRHAREGKPRGEGDQGRGQAGQDGRA